MNFGLALTGNLNHEQSALVVELSNELKAFFDMKDYGGSIKSFTIGIICVEPQFDSFFKAPKPQYIKGKKIIAPDGIPFVVEDAFEYSLKIDLDTLRHAEKTLVKKILVKEIVQSLIVLDSMKKKISNFDAEKFKQDLNNFFNERT